MSVSVEKKRATMPIPSNSIIEWYNGRNILITGATGFMGKVLLEKFLRSCPGINKIYMIIRSKRGLAPKARINEMIKLPIFQKLRESNPDVFKKLIAIEGDTTKENFGISDENKKILQNEISVVFHGAATLRLEAVLKDSVIQNLIASDYLYKFCKGIKNLEVVVHSSTAYCHCDVEILEEKIYTPTKDYRNILNLIEWLDDKSLEDITPNLIYPHPNTYTFTKRLGEKMADDYGKELPVVIIRPSIVIPTLKDPVPGWVDSLNGPVGVMVAAGKGVIRSMLVEANNHAEIIPCDIAANCTIVAAWYRGTNKFTETPVYNLTQGDVYPITWGEVLNRGRKLFPEHPFDWPLWYPDGNIRTNKFVHDIIVFLFQIIPAYFVDFMFMLFMQKRFLVRVQARIKLGMHLLQYFTLREWKFQNCEFAKVVEKIPAKEKDIFYINNVEIDIDKSLKDIIIGARKYCLKEKDENIPFARRYLAFLYYLDRFCRLALVFGFFWMLLQVSNTAQVFHDNYYGINQKI